MLTCLRNLFLRLIAITTLLWTLIGCTDAEFSAMKTDALSKSNVFGDGGSLPGIGGDGTGGGRRNPIFGGDGSGSGIAGGDGGPGKIPVSNVCSYVGARDTDGKTVFNSSAVELKIYSGNALVCHLTTGVKEQILNNRMIDISSCALTANNYKVTINPVGDTATLFSLESSFPIPGRVKMTRASSTSAWRFDGDTRLQVLMDTDASQDGNGEVNPYCTRTASPLVINLTPEDRRDRGLRLTSPERGLLFDILGENAKPVPHTKVQISWLRNPHYMFLALPNAKGLVEGINELFGDNTRGPDGLFAANGYAALAKHDTNADGFIDREDAIFQHLRLWSDRNFNGQSEAKELLSLSEHLLERIDLNYDPGFSEKDRYGNESALKSVVRTTDGRVHVIFDLWFALK